MNSTRSDDSSKHLERIRQLETQVEEQRKVNEVLVKISAASQVEETIQQILEGALLLCHANQGAIFLFSEAKAQEARTLMRKDEGGEQKLDHYLNNQMAGWVSANKQALHTHNLADIFKSKKIGQDYGDIASALSIPLWQDDKIVGVLNLISLEAAQRFGDRELRLASVLGSQCARFIENARMREALFAETARLKEEVQEKFDFHGIIGHSEKMQSVFSLLKRVIPTDARILITGESGTGKERIARTIHYNGPRKNAPFLAVDCGALSANLLESELFGYKKGAFTGASEDRKGLFEEANGGTLFLDEIGNMPPEIQVKFLRAIQEGEIRPLGSTQVKKVDVRIIAATNENLEERVKVGAFRQDLFFRLNVVTVNLPPLRERREDIPHLAHHFLNASAEKYGKPKLIFSPKVITRLENHAWPGNIRELENAVERAVVLSQSEQLDSRDFPFLQSAPLLAEATDRVFEPQPWEEASTQWKRWYLSRVLEHCNGVKSQAAKVLDLQPTYLSRLVKNLGIEK